VAYQVDYDVEVPYRTLPDFSNLSPALEITLRLSAKVARTVGILDTGSTHTVFKNELAMQLGITDITTGTQTTLRSAGGTFDIYLFNIELEVHAGTIQRRFPGQVGFAAGQLPRNILGLNLVFQQFQIGFRDIQQRLYLLSES
jgi:hypothetical protein